MMVNKPTGPMSSGEVSRLAEVPSVRAYAFALSQPFVKAEHRAMLAAHRQAPDLVITAGGLAAAAGYANWRGANQHYGTLGRQVATLLDIEVARYSKGPLWTSALAEGFEVGRGRLRRFHWRLYPEVAEAIDQLGIR